MLEVIRPQGYQSGQMIWHGQLNPYFMAGWVGLLVTGLNMLPVSQLDGGHVMYALLGKYAHWIARGIVLLGISDVVLNQHYHWIVMILLVLLIGVRHPTTRDDTTPLGWLRILIGGCAILIPIFCFAPRLLILPQ